MQLEDEFHFFNSYCSKMLLDSPWYVLKAFADGDLKVYIAPDGFTIKNSNSIDKKLLIKINNWISSYMTKMSPAKFCQDNFTIH